MRPSLRAQRSPGAGDAKPAAAAGQASDSRLDAVVASSPLVAAVWAAAWAVHALCLLHNLRLTRERSGSGLRGALLGAVWLTFTPLFVHMWLGQFTFLLGSMLFWCVLAAEDGRWKAAPGWWIGSVLWKPAS